MDTRLFRFVYWPDRDQLWRTMPQCFQYAFGKKTTVVIDCFEVFIERPSNLLAGAQTFSNYKHHNTIKILVGITPQGTISFVSEAWGGRVSDKFLTENCGFLDKLIPGDMVMADRGFTITESVGLRNAKLVIPAFTKGKSLSLIQWMWSRQEALQMSEFMLNLLLDCLDGSILYWKVPCQPTF